jgi:hypothetical protein
MIVTFWRFAGDHVIELPTGLMLPLRSPVCSPQTAIYPYQGTLIEVCYFSPITSHKVRRTPIAPAQSVGVSLRNRECVVFSGTSPRIAERFLLCLSSSIHYRSSQRQRNFLPSGFFDRLSHRAYRVERLEKEPVL